MIVLNTKRLMVHLYFVHLKGLLEFKKNTGGIRATAIAVNPKEPTQFLVGTKIWVKKIEFHFSVEN